MPSLLLLEVALVWFLCVVVDSLLSVSCLLDGSGASPSAAHTMRTLTLRAVAFGVSGDAVVRHRWLSTRLAPLRRAMADHAG